MTSLPPPPPPPPGGTGPAPGSIPPPPPPGALPGWPPPPPPPAPPGRGRRLLGVGVVLVVLALVVGAVVVLLGAGDDGVAHPDEWDPRVLPLAEFVADARDLPFEHPVYVDFLDPADYTEEATASEDDLGDDDREDLATLAGQLRALGLASGPLDLFGALNTVSDSGTLAFYDPADKRVRVRGTELTPGVRVTLVHELVHALQDQHVDLGELVGDAPDGAASARRGLAEGDALRIEDRYVEELSDADRAAYEAESAQEEDEGRAAVDEVPSYLVAGFGLPYALGRPFVELLDRRGGNDAVDDAFAAPPASEEHLFDSVSYLLEDEPMEVDLGLDDVDDDGDFAPSDWYLLLADRIDPRQALVAALGWGGSRYGTFERDGAACIRAVFVGDRRTDEDELRTALRAWHDELPDALDVDLLEVKGHPGVEGCDPGEDADVAGADRADDLLVLPSLHAYLLADAASLVEPEVARCYGLAVLDGLPESALLDPEGAFFSDPAFEELASASVARCQR